MIVIHAHLDIIVQIQQYLQFLVNQVHIKTKIVRQIDLNVKGVKQDIIKIKKVNVIVNLALKATHVKNLLSYLYLVKLVLLKIQMKLKIDLSVIHATKDIIKIKKGRKVVLCALLVILV